MRVSKLDSDEFDRRCGQVFDAKPWEYYSHMELYDDGSVNIYMYEYDDDGYCMLGFNYQPDMSGRPISVQYLMGDIDEYHYED